MWIPHGFHALELNMRSFILGRKIPLADLPCSVATSRFNIIFCHYLICFCHAYSALMPHSHHALFFFVPSHSISVLFAHCCLSSLCSQWHVYVAHVWTCLCSLLKGSLKVAMMHSIGHGHVKNTKANVFLDRGDLFFHSVGAITIIQLKSYRCFPMPQA